MPADAPAPSEKTAPRPRPSWLILLSVLGPGLIAAAAGNEAGGILTYSRIGATHGYSMLWLLLLSTFSLIVAQEMGTRMAVVTGKGLADLIREEFGVRVAVFAMVILFLANTATTVSEFAGITSALELFLPAWSRYIVVPLISIGLWFLVVRGSYGRVEKVFLIACSVYLSYIVAAFLAHPPWALALRETVTVQLPLRRDPTYVRDAIALIGTTIAPWMQFYVQSSVRDKGIKADHYAYERFDVFLGSTLSNVISFFIVVACAATLWATGHRDVNSADEAARALTPFAGRWATILFAVGLFNASAVGAVIVPLSTAYAVTEAIGAESGLGRKVRDAPLFIGIFTLLIALSTLIVLIPGVNLIKLITGAQVLNGVLLPIILILMLRIINKRRLMGRFVNGPVFNVIAWATVGLVVALSIASLFLG